MQKENRQTPLEFLKKQRDAQKKKTKSKFYADDEEAASVNTNTNTSNGTSISNDETMENTVDKNS